jgi:hypothetical protein
MANCNECTNLEIVLETDDGCKNFNHICTRHGVSVRWSGKRFNGYIWPCVECNGDNFTKRKGNK